MTSRDKQNEVHLRHLTVEDAIDKLDKYLDEAFIAGRQLVRIVHGKGTGTLRQATTKHLDKHSLVASHRVGEYGEGGNGVTIVRLVPKTR